MTKKICMNKSKNSLKQNKRQIDLLLLLPTKQIFNSKNMLFLIIKSNLRRGKMIKIKMEMKKRKMETDLLIKRKRNLMISSLKINLKLMK